ncbi:MAG: ABC transporter ATP-binding protein [Candidatus Sumerlaeia bacterium]
MAEKALARGADFLVHERLNLVTGMRNALKLFCYLRHYKAILSVVVFSVLMVALLNVSSIGLLKPVLEVFFGEVGTEQGVAPTGGTEALVLDPLSAASAADSASPRRAGHEEEESFRRWVRSVEAFKPLVGLYDAAKAKAHEARAWFYNQFRQGRRMHLLVVLALIIVGLEVLKFTFQFLSEYLSAYVGFQVIRQIRDELYRHILRQDLAFFDKQTTGHLMSRLTGDVNGVRDMLMEIFSDTMQAPLNFLFIGALLFYLNWQMTLVLVVFAPITALAIRYFGRKVKKYTRKAREKVADLSGSMQEIISNILTVKAFQMEEYEQERFAKLNFDHVKALLRAKRVRVLSSPAMDLLGAVSVAIVILIGGYFITQVRNMTGSTFIVYIVALSRLYKPIKIINKSWGKVQEGLAYTERIFQIFDTKSQIVDKPGAVELAPLRREIKIEDLSFEYRPGHPVLQNITLTVKAGTMLAIVGETGSGKSTIVKLLLRLYDPQRGRILFDGVDLRDAAIASLRRQTAVVLQENILFNDTITNNILCGRRGYSREDVIEAARIANALEFIERLPRGFDTVVGERGKTLSGGQRQRIAIARAILTRPALLILDEATSSLDSHAERLVQTALEQAIKGRTTIVIAHRLSTVMNADQIVVLSRDGGRIVEQGSHQELLEAGGVYAHLCARQFLTPAQT